MSKTNPYTMSHGSTHWPLAGEGSLERFQDRRDRRRLINAVEQLGQQQQRQYQEPVQQPVPGFQPTELSRTRPMSDQEAAESAAALIALIAFVIKNPIGRTMAGCVLIAIGLASGAWITIVAGFALVVSGFWSANQDRILLAIARMKNKRTPPAPPAAPAYRPTQTAPRPQTAPAYRPDQPVPAPQTVPVYRPNQNWAAPAAKDQPPQHDPWERYYQPRH